MTATEASRAFSALLDAIEAGDTVAIERGGRRVAVVSPVSTANGSDVRRLLVDEAVEARFVDDLAAVRELVREAGDGRSWPDDA